MYKINNQAMFLLECALLYSHVAVLALDITSLGGSKEWAGSGGASLIAKMLDKVPSGSRLGLNAVLFFRIIEWKKFENGSYQLQILPARMVPAQLHRQRRHDKLPFETFINAEPN